MKRTSLCIVSGTILAACLVASVAFAGPKAAKFRHADKNKDGKIGPREAAIVKHNAYLRNRSDVDRPWEAEADKNGDNKVDAVELRSFHVAKLDKNGDGKIDGVERRLYWLDKRAVVNTDVEKKYDADGNGYLSWDEAKEMLKDKLVVISTRGKAIVSNDIEMEFDTNDDGIIDASEAPALRAALEEAKATK